MTTIAYRDGVLATDSRCCHGDRILSETHQKLKILPDGSVCAVAGAVARGEGYIKSIIAGTADKELLGGEEASWATVIILTKDYLEEHNSEGIVQFSLKDFYAWGSGADAALTAMHLDANAVAAAKIAAKIDIYSNANVCSAKYGAAQITKHYAGD